LLHPSPILVWGFDVRFECDQDSPCACRIVLETQQSPRKPQLSFRSAECRA